MSSYARGVLITVLAVLVLSPDAVLVRLAKLDLWAKELAPSTELRQCFAHEPERFPVFRSRYREELKSKTSILAEVMQASDGQSITLLYSARDRQHDQAVRTRRPAHARYPDRAPGRSRSPRAPGRSLAR